MRLSRIGAGALLLIALVYGPAYAADPPPPDSTQLAAATRLVNDTGGEKRMEQVLNAMRGLMVRMIAQHGKDTDAAGKIVDELLLPAMRSHLPELQVALVQFWASSMSQNELETADAFFRSPIGRKMIEVEAQATPTLLAIGRVWGQRALQDVLTAQKEALRQRGVSL